MFIVWITSSSFKNGQTSKGLISKIDHYLVSLLDQRCHSFVVSGVALVVSQRVQFRYPPISHMVKTVC